MEVIATPQNVMREAALLIDKEKDALIDPYVGYEYLLKNNFSETQAIYAAIRTVINHTILTGRLHSYEKAIASGLIKFIEEKPCEEQ